MSQKDHYKTLGVAHDASEADIKKAYRKLAMQYHPDKNKGDKKAETKFKEINAAYEVVGDAKKRKQYDTFGSAGEQFGGFSWGQQGAHGFEDIFSQFGGARGGSQSQHFDFDLGDIFGGGMGGGQRSSHAGGSRAHHAEKPEEPVLDVTKTVEVPVIDLMLGIKVDVETVYSKHLSLTVPLGTKSGTKFRIRGKGRQSGGATGDMYVIVEAKMPKEIPDDVRILLESVKYRL